MSTNGVGEVMPDLFRAEMRANMDALAARVAALEERLRKDEEALVSAVEADVVQPGMRAGRGHRPGRGAQEHRGGDMMPIFYRDGRWQEAVACSLGCCHYMPRAWPDHDELAWQYLIDRDASVPYIEVEYCPHGGEHLTVIDGEPRVIARAPIEHARGNDHATHSGAGED